ncbi:hypothetical protein EV200_11256 [Pedobacter psychrotolerans]|uniref:GIY-YIG domain-containing protein n=1 Tax=Pedobacter psychrotolerans TaxID=1843235 RepID=A0A4R2H199_9SPHI|nr:hypothetical protein [Pedobacter psychrotolerans]TCO18250.1 hypothetical protein EV200_11256 [Pedobacter psychrotolerans]GGE70917.1 hypothetical protein GCM10011413_42080 [Pedobacter psychrotolerans]
MFDELTKYKKKDHFFFRATDALSQVCNAPTNQSGIYIVYALKNGKIELVYIGRSGKIKSDGTMFIRKTGLGGIKDRIVNGHQFGKIARRKSWPIQMLSEGIEALDVYWYATHDINLNDCPRLLENKLLKRHTEIFGQLPKWNREF